MFAFLFSVAAITGLSVLARIALEELLLKPTNEASVASRGFLGS